MNKATQPDVIRFGMYSADFRTQQLRKGGIRIKLPRQSFLILQMLLERPSELVPRDELRQNLWPADTFVDFDHGLNNAVTRLRDALNDSSEAPRYIETIPRLGYRFVGPVEDAAPPVATDEKTAPAVISLNHRKKYAIRLAVGGTLALVAASAILLELNVRGWRDRLLPAPRAVRSLAVLPLDDLSGDAGQEYFADGITDELITEMAHLQPLKVISRTSVMRYKGVRKPLPEIASELGVDAILEGSVTRSGQQLRITAQLIDAHSDTHLWSAEYTREMRDIISLQREVASDIAEKIRLQLLPEQRARLAAARPVDPEAHELFLKGLHFWDMRTTESMNHAIAYFSQSVTHDPEFAPGWAYLSTSHCILHSHEASPPQLEYSKALEAAEKALQLDPMSAEAHAAMGCVRFLFEWDFRVSLAELQRATELDPSYGLGHQWYSHQLVRTGMPGPAIEEIKRALAVDPVSLRVNASYASRMMEARQYSAAIHQLLVALELYPAEVSLRRVLAQAYDHSGDPQRAGEQFGKFLAGDQQGRAFLKSCQPLEYRRCEPLFTAEEANRDVAALEVKRKKGEYASPASFADAYLRLGDKQKTIYWLKLACEEHSAYPLDFVLPQFDTLRSEPEFQALVARVGLPQASALALAK